MKFSIAIFTLLSCFIASCQNNDLVSQLYDNYEDYLEKSLDKRRIKYTNIEPLIKKLKNNPKYVVKKVGESIEGRDLNLISIGSGRTNVFLWSQMHGDEPTATQAIFDIFNFLNSARFKAEKEKMLKQVTLHFLPMLNPDGAERFERRNTLGIDINRDALRLQSPEGKTLKRIRDSLKADFGFNLHDQSTYYNVNRTSKPASVSFLAPAFNYEKDVNEIRGNAMKVIVYMNRVIQKYAAGQVGRYNDDFEPRAFGDNIQKWGTSTILIESGGYLNDIEKQEIRRLNFVSILAAIQSIAYKSFKDIAIEEYETIPKNDRQLLDLKLIGPTYKLLGNDYVLDIGINHQEVDIDENSSFYNVGRIMDLGDLSTYYGYRTLNLEGYTIVEGQCYPETLESLEDLNKLDIHQLLKSGYAYIAVKELPEGKRYIDKPIIIIKENYEQPELSMHTGVNPTFLLKKKDKIEYAVINGFLIDLKANSNFTKNSLILK